MNHNSPVEELKKELYNHDDEPCMIIMGIEFFNCLRADEKVIDHLSYDYTTHDYYFDGMLISVNKTQKEDFIIKRKEWRDI